MATVMVAAIATTMIIHRSSMLREWGRKSNHLTIRTRRREWRLNTKIQMSLTKRMHGATSVKQRKRSKDMMTKLVSRSTMIIIKEIPHTANHSQDSRICTAYQNTLSLHMKLRHHLHRLVSRGLWEMLMTWKETQTKSINLQAMTCMVLWMKRSHINKKINSKSRLTSSGWEHQVMVKLKEAVQIRVHQILMLMDFSGTLETITKTILVL